jgi:hypothetical protein
MTIEMVVTLVRPQNHMEGHQVMEEIELRSVEGFKPSATMRVRLSDPEQFEKFRLYQKVNIQV